MKWHDTIWHRDCWGPFSCAYVCVSSELSDVSLLWNNCLFLKNLWKQILIVQACCPQSVTWPCCLTWFRAMPVRSVILKGTRGKQMKWFSPHCANIPPATWIDHFSALQEASRSARGNLGHCHAPEFEWRQLPRLQSVAQQLSSEHTTNGQSSRK